MFKKFPPDNSAVRGLITLKSCQSILITLITIGVRMSWQSILITLIMIGVRMSWQLMLITLMTFASHNNIQ